MTMYARTDFPKGLIRSLENRYFIYYIGSALIEARKT